MMGFSASRRTAHTQAATKIRCRGGKGTETGAGAIVWLFGIEALGVGCSSSCHGLDAERMLECAAFAR
jgi:hypothetical protein